MYNLQLKAMLLSLLLIAAACLNARNPYRNYLLSKIISRPPPALLTYQCNTTAKTMSIPHYQIPTGSVFCRLEDKLTRATKVWVKIGVQ
jgi:hypothetical protein